MCRTPSTPTQYSSSAVRGLPACILTAWFIASTPLVDASPSEAFRHALPLPTDHSIDGYATTREPALYTIDVTAPGFLVIEAHATGLPTLEHQVRVFGPNAQHQETGLPVTTIRGRHIQRVVELGTYSVEVKASRPDAAGFRLYAWAIEQPGDPLEPMDETDEIYDDIPSLEPMDETDEFHHDPQPLEAMDKAHELHGGSASLEPMDETDEFHDGSQSLEPMDETDEIYGGSLSLEPMEETDKRNSKIQSLEPMDETDEFGDGSQSWQEIPGFGLMEIASGDRLRRHPWCSWTERPELLSTFSCARQLRIDATQTFTIHPISSTSSEMIRLALRTSGRITLEARDGLGPATALFDSQGRLLAEPTAGEPIWLEAGSAFLRLDIGPNSEVLFDIEID